MCVNSVQWRWIRKETQEGWRLEPGMGGKGGGGGQAYRAVWRWKGIRHLRSQRRCECVSLSNVVSKSSLTPCAAHLTRGSGALQESAVSCLWDGHRAGARPGPLKFTRHAVGAGGSQGDVCRAVRVTKLGQGLQMPAPCIQFQT